MLRAGRPLVPPKMTSSISPPRMRLAEFSPITQRSASTRFDLPQPLGPTMPVIPDSITSSVGSTKDLKPLRRSLEKCTGAGFRLAVRRERAEPQTDPVEQTRRGIGGRGIGD